MNAPALAQRYAKLSSFTATWQRLPAILAFALLLIQISIPWTVRHFVTEDGPSHLYTAVVAKTLLLHPHSDYSKVYRINRRIVPNWGSTILLGAIVSLVGVDHAEKLLMSICLVAGFFAFSYAIRSLAPEASPWTPLTNFLLQTWFLWLGFYNFYLAMVLSPFLIGFYIRHASKLTTRRAFIMAGGFIALFLTHLIATTLAIVAVMMICVWVHIIAPFVLPAVARPGRAYVRIALRQVAVVIATLLPVLALFGWFVKSSKEPFHFESGAWDAWYRFPMHVFTTADWFSGNQSHLWPAVLSYIVFAITGMRRPEWRTARGGLALAILATFVIYLFVPETGFGGSIVKIRYSWAVFILGALLACSVRRLRPLRVPMAIYVSGFLIINLIPTARALSAYSVAVEDYLSALAGLPKGARFVRLRYQTPDLPERYGYHEIARDPLFHLDAYAAARCACLDLSDYQAPNKIFPVIFNRTIDSGMLYGLWALEGPGPETGESLKWLRENLPVPIDYVILVADESSKPLAGEGLTKVLANLDSGMRLIAESRSVPFVHLYQRVAKR